jgi:hypothetical protein
VPTEDIGPELRAAATRGPKAIIMDGDSSYDVTQPKLLKNVNSFYNIDAVVKFAKDNWQRVGAIQTEKQKILAAEGMRQKMNAAETSTSGVEREKGVEAELDASLQRNGALSLHYLTKCCNIM